MATSDRLFWNPRAARGDAYPGSLRALFNAKDWAEARACIGRWPGYAPTPLHALVGQASALGLGALWYKDESERFGLGSFKALGGAYGVARVLADELGVDEVELVRGTHRDAAASYTVACASDGNHGKSVAWGASLCGCRAVVYLSRRVPVVRREAIRSYGAEVVIVDGTYDDAVQRCAADADANDWWLVTDSAWPGHVELPRYVMEGYTVLAAEALEQLPAGQRLSHVFVPGGVGGLAASVCAYLWDTLETRRPTFVVVEPTGAACLRASARAGGLTELEVVEETVLTGLACARPSSLAWEALRTGADAFLTISDEEAAEAMRTLAAGSGGDAVVVAGATGASALAGLRSAAREGETRRALGLSEESAVLVVGTEGASDPDLYARLVGRAASEVGRRA